MAEYRQVIEAKYKFDTFEGTKNNCQWISDTVKNIFDEHLVIDYNFNFSIGDISCHCYTMQEFIENAYGNNYELISITIGFVKNDGECIVLFSVLNDKLSIRTSSKMTLEKIVARLKDTNKDEIEDVSNTTNIHNQYNTIIGTISGDNNSIIQDSNDVYTTPHQSNFKEWVKGIFQGIIANWIWWALGAITLAVAGYFAIK